jgi:hypothetical protein
MSRTVLALVAVGAAVIAVALGVAWRGKMSDQAVIDQAAKPAVAAAPAPTPAETRTSPSPPPPAAVTRRPSMSPGSAPTAAP